MLNTKQYEVPHEISLKNYVLTKLYQTVKQLYPAAKYNLTLLYATKDIKK